MKVEDLKKELTAKIKNLIFEILKDFDMSNTAIDVYFQDYHCSIYVKNTLLKIHISYSEDLGFSKVRIGICSELNEKVDRYGKSYPKDYKFVPTYCSLEEYIQFINKEPILDSELIQIIKTLYNNKDILEKELKNILE